MTGRRTTLSTTLALALAVATAGCASSEPAASSPESSSSAAEPDLAAFGIAGLSGAEAVDTLEAVPVAERSTDLMASVQSTALELTTPDGETSLPLPEDLFYLSVAPYVEQTHPCGFHSLTTCRGELGGEDIDVEVVDEATGETILDETRTAADNGFVGLWLPRDIEATLTVALDGKTSTTSVSTDDDAETCLTTMQLT
ncbi:hypothetical protein GCM10025865_27320 [Paraoerskovia sediminicola]|uniref:CueP family metal-binding protein n=1 Tax=Paraoerskovia sediminicola TaxID=1138587 RepID=A0ABM8G5J6_9CELL|nr:CueP family metal-binding protein [Paraoerskovia sediminicola]BDZ43433.1 hypothetical protein GCM10025865_27320 [Paraoerskovia sediminicola]